MSFVVVALATAIALTGIAVPARAETPLPPGGSFWDDYLNIHEPAIEAVAAEGITRGCNPPVSERFCPEKAVDRGQMAAFLVRALDLPATSDDFFVDDEESIFEADVNRLAAAGITKGCNPPANDRYCPAQVVLRDQMASFLARALDLSPIAPPPVVGHDPRWPHTVSVLTDSVVLGAERYLPDGFPDWDLEMLGKPALMLHQVEDEFFPPGEKVSSLVAVGLGYNSLWERDRYRYDMWAERFDRQADEVIRVLLAHGALQIAWVTLREPWPEAIETDQQRDQMERWGWYLPYVNERIRLLPERHPQVVVADWAAVSHGPGLTYDLIHLNPDGARLMTNVISGAFGFDPPFD